MQVYVKSQLNRKSKYQGEDYMAEKQLDRVKLRILQGVADLYGIGVGASG